MVNAQELIPFLQNNKYGYSDSEGNLIISPQFDNAELFEKCGLAYVQFGEKWNMVSRTGKVILPENLGSKPEWRKVFDNENLGLNNYSKIENAAIIVLPGEEYSWGLYSGDTDIFEGSFRFKFLKDSLSPIYLRSAAPLENRQYPNFTNGSCLVEKTTGDYNYLKINAKLVLPIFQKNITHLNKKYFSVENENGKQNIYDYAGQKVLETEFSFLASIGWESENNIDDVFMTLSSPTRSNFQLFDRSLRSWSDYKGLINIKGKVLLETIYSTIIVCSNGKAIVWKGNEKVYYDLDKQKWIEPFEIPKIEYKRIEREYPKYTRDPDYDFPNKNYKIERKIFESKFDTLYEYCCRDTFIVRNKRADGVVDTLGNIVLPFQYYHIHPLANGNFFKVREYAESPNYVVDRNNKIVSKKELYWSHFKNGDCILSGDGKIRLFNLDTKIITIFNGDGAEYFRDKNYRWHPFLLKASKDEKRFYINYKTGMVYQN